MSSERENSGRKGISSDRMTSFLEMLSWYCLWNIQMKTAHWILDIWIWVCNDSNLKSFYLFLKSVLRGRYSAAEVASRFQIFVLPQQLYSSLSILREPMTCGWVQSHLEKDYASQPSLARCHHATKFWPMAWKRKCSQKSLFLILLVARMQTVTRWLGQIDP